MGYTLIVTEKPTAARTIAKALADGKIEKHEENGAVWYEIKKGKKKYVIAPAAGHLYTLKQKEKGWDYPRFDVEWIPSFKASKTAKFSEKYFRVLEKLAKDATDVIIATDYDDEGEVIGYNILRFMLGREKAKRMKFSTMTKEELEESFKNMIKINKNLAEAGLTRHYMDWYFGINLTRALTNSIKKVGKRFRIISTGRVQGPTLYFLAKHEEKIKAFKPKPFWQVELELKLRRNIYKAVFEKDKIWDKKEAEEILKKADKKFANVKDVKKRVITQKPPKPYNTTSFVADVYRYFGYSPRDAMRIAESLYQAGYISYPRTASEKLPPDIDYKKILSSLSKISKYKKLCNRLLVKDELKPNEGKKTDPAHPAIYPTAQVPKKLGSKQQKVYDLVVHRFLAIFGEPAKRESQKVILDVDGKIFFLSGIRTIEPGWTELYGKYAAREETILPELKIGDKIEIRKVNLISKETQPPQRYSQGSVIKEMEVRGLGTKATRPQILQILYNRGYLFGKSIEVTELGLNLAKILKKNVSDIVSEELTRKFEEETDAIERGEKTMNEVLEEVKKAITKISKKFKKKELKIGKELTESVVKTYERQSILGKCPKCGGTIKVFKMWKTGNRFAGCTNYKKGCDFSAPLPREGLIIPTGKVCPHCGTPIIEVRRSGKRPFRMCLDPNCPTKKDWVDKERLAESKRKWEEKKKKK